MRGTWRRGSWKRRVGTLVAAVALAATAGACAAPGGATASGIPGCSGPGGPPDAVTARVFSLTNSDRAGSGLRPLSWNPQLWCLASDWSSHMGTTDTLQHRDLNVTIREPAFSSYSTLGENILRGASSLSGDQMEYAWWYSPEHQANILSPSYSSVGIALYYTPDGKTVYATENFGG